MKRTITLAIAALLLCAGQSMALTLATNLVPADAGTALYQYPINTEDGLKGLQDATPRITLISNPDNNAYTQSVTMAFSGTVYYCTATNWGCSAYHPVGWDTTLWPVADPNGVVYRYAIVTGAPTRTVLERIAAVGDIYTLSLITTSAAGTAGNSGVSTIANKTVTNYNMAVMTTNSHTFTWSNVWYNINGTTNGWVLVP